MERRRNETKCLKTFEKQIQASQKYFYTIFKSNHFSDFIFRNFHMHGCDGKGNRHSWRQLGDPIWSSVERRVLCSQVQNKISLQNYFFPKKLSPYRCGRTARIGNQGSAVIFLLPTEDTYVDFISLNQQVWTLDCISLEKFVICSMLLFQVKLQSLSPPENIPNLLTQIRSWQRNDRSIFDKATRAFVSFIQAYSKHECKFVLRLKGLQSLERNCKDDEKSFQNFILFRSSLRPPSNCLRIAEDAKNARVEE